MNQSMLQSRSLYKVQLTVNKKHQKQPLYGVYKTQDYKN